MGSEKASCSTGHLKIILGLDFDQKRQADLTGWIQIKDNRFSSVPLPSSQVHLVLDKNM